MESSRRRERAIRRRRARRIRHFFGIAGIVTAMGVAGSLAWKNEDSVRGETTGTIQLSLNETIMPFPEGSVDMTLVAVGEEAAGQSAATGQDTAETGTPVRLCTDEDAGEASVPAEEADGASVPAEEAAAGERKERVSLGLFEVTAYCSCEKCCGPKAVKLTKSGTVPRAGHTVAADPKVLPLGSRIEIDNIVYTVEDTGKLIKGNIIDIYFDTHEEALNFGRQEKEVYLVSR